MKKYNYDAYSGYHYGKYRKRFDDYCDDDCVYDETETQQNTENASEADRSHYIIYGELCDAGEAPKKKLPPHVIEDMRSYKKQSSGKEKIKTKTTKEKARKRGGKSTVIVICLLIMCFSLTVICADIFGGGTLFAKYVSFMGIGSDNAGTSFYALYVFSAEDISTAYTYSTAIREQGAGGYVLKNGDIYCVVANIYDNKPDAESVSKNIAGSAVLELKINNFNKNVFPEELKSAAEKSKNLYKTVYAELYDIGVALESGKITPVAAMNELNGLRLSVSNTANSYAESASGMSETVVLEYKVQLNSILSALGNLTDTSISRPSLLADVRYYSCMIIHNFYGFAKEYM